MGYTSPFKVTVQMHEVIRRKNVQSAVAQPEINTEQTITATAPNEAEPIESAPTESTSKESAQKESAPKETAKTQSTVPPEPRSSKKRSIDEVSAPSSLPVPKRPLAALPTTKSTASTEIEPLPTDIPIFENVTLYDIVIHKSYNSEEELRSHYLDKEGAIAAFIEEVNENSKDQEVEAQERIRYNKDGLPYTIPSFE